jgi:CheY-like chemotaxis protein
VDDSATIRTIIAHTLKVAGYCGVSFADGVKALKWLDEHPDMQPTLVYLDAQMPEIDGYAWATYIKSKPRFHHTAIVLMSGEALGKTKAGIAGVTAYIEKPFTTQTILTTARTYIQANALVAVDKERVS